MTYLLCWNTVLLATNIMRISKNSIGSYYTYVLRDYIHTYYIMAFLCLKDEKLRSILLSPSNLKAGCLVAIFEKRGREKENASIVISSIMAKLEMTKNVHFQG